MINRREQTLERVKDIVLGEIADANVKVYLFGSWARGEERRSSGIDIALDWVGAVRRQISWLACVKFWRSLMCHFASM